MGTSNLLYAFLQMIVLYIVKLSLMSFYYILPDFDMFDRWFVNNYATAKTVCMCVCKRTCMRVNILLLFFRVSVSVISIKGTSCKLVELGQVAEATQGQVSVY